MKKFLTAMGCAVTVFISVVLSPTAHAANPAPGWINLEIRNVGFVENTTSLVEPVNIDQANIGVFVPAPAACASDTLVPISIGTTYSEYGDYYTITEEELCSSTLPTADIVN